MKKPLHPRCHDLGHPLIQTVPVAAVGAVVKHLCESATSMAGRVNLDDVHRGV